MGKTLVLIRHAHRDTQIRSKDNGLSPKGHKQTEALVRFFRKRQESMNWDVESGLFLSSSKKRCLETLQPLADISKQQVKVSADLVEQEPSESFAQLQTRIENFLEWFKNEGPSWCVACSHGDWIPLAVHSTLKMDLEIRKASWLELEFSRGQFDLKWFVPSFKYF